MYMGKIIVGDQEKEVADGAKVINEAESLGITFGCQDGICGTCIVEVEEGMENLSERNQAEVDMALEGNQRLACQCTLKKGTVKFKY